MEKNKEQNLPLKPDSQIQLILNQQDDEEDTIDLGRVFHNARAGARIYAWVLLLCMLMGLSASLLMYQIGKAPLTVTSVVTLRYSVPNPEYEKMVQAGQDVDESETPREIQVNTLIAPDKKELDLNQVTASEVIREALSGLSLSQDVSIDNIQSNMTVTRVLTADSARTREIIAGMAENKNNDLYNQLQRAQMEYQNRFIVSLTNGFGDDKIYLKDEELRIVLDRILEAYNQYLVETYADVRLPENKIALIDTENMDTMEILDQLNSAMKALLDYCRARPDSVRAYRSWRTGRSLEDWMENITTFQEVSLSDLEVQLYSRGLVKAPEEMVATYQQQLRTLRQKLDQINETIAETDKILKSYKNDNVIVSMQESDASKTTKVTTNYYNELILKQAESYSEAEGIRLEMDEIQDKLAALASLNKSSDTRAAELKLSEMLENARQLYRSVRTHMEEAVSSSLFATYAEHSAPQGKEPGFIQSVWKRALIFTVVGAVLGCGIWFLAALAPEFSRTRKNEEKDPEKEEAAK